MAVLTSKLRSTNAGMAHWCPGCEEMHILPKDRGWFYSQNLDALSANPSFKHTWRNRQGEKCCHYVITNGALHYCGDCTHGLAGQVIPIPDIPAHEQLGMPGCE